MAKAKEPDSPERLWNKVVLSLMAAETAWVGLKQFLPFAQVELERMPVSAQRMLGTATVRAEAWIGLPTLIERARVTGGLQGLLVEERKEEPHEQVIKGD